MSDKMFTQSLADTSMQLPAAFKPLAEQIYMQRLTTAPGVEICAMELRHPRPRATLVFSNGRVESFVKYLELFAELHDKGYSLYALDHRGQGLSSRLTANPHQGHVARFDDYIDDFKIFMDKLVLPRAEGPLLLSGHSMGGCIGSLYLERHGGQFLAAAFSAPMYGIRLPMSKVFIRWLAHKLDSSDKGQPNYILGGGDYEATPFAKNDLTHCRERYDDYRALYQANPQLQLGSPTNRWLLEALDACDASVLAARESKIPLLILQADEDSIVDNEAQKRAVGGRCQLVNIANAKHELFMENDVPRAQTLDAMLAFFEPHLAQAVA
ncbi:alpha/beta fold hydrolase [Shewanella cyperi]|uniref:alpha/beta fold hydrolase n=1 Tax=Shewanella cyperi TaxID=2814292 RepID=UPI001D18DCA0|nr:alpha/beta fold hydrolase [Shewanella cyperi]